jgi:nucleoside-diphosphate-sugar epimerase
LSNYLVTGGLGFVGSYLVEDLLKNNHNVIAIDDLSNGKKENVKEHPNLEVIIGDVSTLLVSQNSLIKNIDGIFHLATTPRSFSFDNPYNDIETICKGMIRMLELAKKNNCKLVFTSNSGIAGSMDLGDPITEKYPDRPSTPYDANKLVCEHYAKLYHNVYGVKSALVRFATIYGYRQVVNTKLNWKPLVATFLQQMKNNETVYINGDGNQTRDLTYVKDAVQGVIKAMDSNVVNGDMAIISTNTETSVNQVFSTLARLTGYDKKPIYNDALKGDLKSMKLSWDKAKELFGYTPTYNPESGISEMISLYE